MEPGAQCDDPFECPFKAYYSRDIELLIQPEYSLNVLYRIHTKTKDALRAKGIEDACLVPSELLNATQQGIQRASQTGVAELSPDAGVSLAGP